MVCQSGDGTHRLGCPIRVAESIRRGIPGEGPLETVECPSCGARVPHVYVGPTGYVGIHPDPKGDSGACEGANEETVLRGYLDLPDRD